MENKHIHWKALIINILISMGVGALASFFTKNNTDVYSTLIQPLLAPPAVVFPIVWTILFLLMGISAYLVFVSPKPLKKPALVIYGMQLAVNFFWLIFFFNLQLYLFSFIWLMLLWVLVIIMLILFASVRKSAACLQIPYFLWITFAAYLNLGIYLLNR